MPTLLDRFLQQAAFQVLGPWFEPHFSETGTRLGAEAVRTMHAASPKKALGGPWTEALDSVCRAPPPK
jgi:hypothetical protein